MLEPEIQTNNRKDELREGKNADLSEKLQNDSPKWQGNTVNLTCAKT